MPKLAFITLGCPKNEVDTETMRRAAEGAGWLPCEDPADADAVLINTCAFIQEASEASIETILDTAESVQVPIVVAGCLVNRYSDDLTRELPEIAAFIRIGDCEALTEVLTELDGSTPRACPNSHDPLNPTSLRCLSPRSYHHPVPQTFAYLKIADGCDRCCSYCTIPSIRGPYRSRELSDILSETKERIDAGTRELILIAQDTGLYGQDLSRPTTLINLIEQLVALSGLKRLRLMYLQPEGLSDELLAVMAKHDVIIPYLEVPLQHVSPDILSSMGRKPTDAQHFEKQLARARALMPNLAIRTTLIAGYPGETPKQFDELCAFVRRFGFDYTGVFAYSPEEGTRAASLPGQLPEEIRRQRAQILRDIADDVGWQKAADRVGESCEVLIEGYDEDERCSFGRAFFQTPDIDGIVTVSGVDALTQNSYVTVQLTDAFLYDLEGEIYREG